MDESEVNLWKFGDQELVSVAFDYLVLCTGTNFDYPIHSNKALTLEEWKEEFVRFEKQIDESKSVLVVGSGATGLEIAGILD